MKAALGVQLAAALASGYGLHASAAEECVDVLADGFAFRLVLYSGRDEAMLVRVGVGWVGRSVGGWVAWVWACPAGVER